ncbi:hypothetical protein BJ969_000190 [Saccharopolyspora gloriosae]|uniref:Uncharacterized protein n=1 Tax=Saccharopolyspora gloriosae TaxID=455344 RepID=A0A840NCZ8_9PSEU|nr:hypothetical protein [Saccharopolyspora gloriosae]
MIPVPVTSPVPVMSPVLVMIPVLWKCSPSLNASAAPSGSAAGREVHR